MRKEGKKLRDIKFFSKKNDKMIVLHSEAELAYAQKLEDANEGNASSVG